MPYDRLSGRMAELARDLRSQEDLASTLQHVVDATVGLIPACDFAGITLARRGGVLYSSAATDGLHKVLDELQQELGEGPCVDAVWEQRVVRVDDLARDERWPRWRQQAVSEHGLRSAVCIQLFTREDTVGALVLYSATPSAFSDEEVEEAIAIGAHAAVAIAAAQNIQHLSLALHNRTVIGQATGLMMLKYGLGAAAAFNVLARISSETNRKVASVAHEIVDSWERNKML